MHPIDYRVAALALFALATPAWCVAQGAPAYSSPGGPQQIAPMYGVQPDHATPGDRKGRMRQFFANSLSLLMEGTGVSATAGLSEMVVGGISEWFDRRKRRKQERAQAAANGATTYAPTLVNGATPYPQAPPPVYLTPDVSSFAPYQPPGPDSASTYAPVQYYDATTGAESTAPAYLPAYDPYPAAQPSTADGPAADTLYAGMAYEIHALGVDGSSFAVNPAQHEFRTGDQFIVLYRPTLPGHVRVVNVNPLGIETAIDSVEVAAGELKRLGPYRFEATRGEEALRFELTPCSSQPLYATTRDIVKADDAGTAPGAALQFASCGQATLRSIRRPATRDIRKVAVEGNTGFAFDPVSPPELASGELARRQFTVMFRHR